MNLHMSRVHHARRVPSAARRALPRSAAGSGATIAPISGDSCGRRCCRAVKICSGEYSRYKKKPSSKTVPGPIRRCPQTPHPGTSHVLDLATSESTIFVAHNHVDNGNGLATAQNTDGNSYLFCTGGDCSQPPPLVMGGEPPNDAISNDPIIFDNMLFAGLTAGWSFLRSASVLNGAFGIGAKGATEATAEGAGTAASTTLRLTVHGAARLAEKGISQAMVDEAVSSAEQTGAIVSQIGKYGTIQQVYHGTNGISVVVETEGRNASSVITAYFTGTKP